MPKNDLFYNCGEFRPGKRPVRDIPDKGPPKGSNHTPIDGRTGVKRPGGGIPVPPEESFKCESPSPGQQPIGTDIVCGPCSKCTPDDIAADAKVSDPSKKRCKYKSRSECEQKKVDDPICCRKVTRPPPDDPDRGRGGGGTPEPPTGGRGGGGGGGGGPPTGGREGITTYKCVQYKGKVGCNPCLPNETTYIHPKTGKTTKCSDRFSCELNCSLILEDLPNPPIFGDPPIPGDPEGRTGPITPRGGRSGTSTQDNSKPGDRFVDDSEVIQIVSPQASLPFDYLELGYKPPLQENSTTLVNPSRLKPSPSVVNKSPIEPSLNVEAVARDYSFDTKIQENSLIINLDDPSKSATVLPGNVLDFESPKTVIETNYTFGIVYSDANIREFSENPEFGGVENFRWLNIFSNVVDWRIEKLLSNFGTSSTWESEWFNVSLENLELSLRPQLKQSIEKIQQIDKTFLPKNKILEALRDLLVHNNLYQFDAEYFLTLANRISNPKHITPAKQTFVKERNAIAYALTNAQLIDASAVANRAGEELKISPAFFSDIKTHTFIELSGVTYKVYLDDAGLNLIFSGTGEYVDPSLYSEIPLTYGDDLTQLDLEDSKERSFSLVNEDKYLIGKLTDIEMGDVLVASSVVSASEFGTGYDLDSDLSAMFFVADRETVESLTRDSNVIGKTRIVYRKVAASAVESTFEENKFRWGNTYFINPQDPFAVYLHQTSSTIQATFKDFNIHSMVDITDEEDTLPIFVRKLPWYLIVIPATGKYSPLNISSKLDTYTTTGITRSIITNPHFDQTLGADMLFNKPLGIEYANVYPNPDASNEINAQGLVHEINLSAVEAPYFNTTSYQITDEARKRPPLGNVIRMINNLNNNYYLNKGLNWYDIVKRLTVEEVGGFIAGYDVTRELVETIMRGEFPETPVKVFHSLYTPDDRYLTRIISAKSETITINDEIDVGSPVLPDVGGSGPL